MEKILIPYRNISIKDDGSYTVGETSGGGAYAYWGRWIGITMLQSYVDFCDILEDKFSALETVPESDSAAAVEEIDAIIKNAQSAGVDAATIPGYDVYIQKGADLPRVIGCNVSSDLENCTIDINFGTDVNISENELKLYNSADEEVEFTFNYADNTASVVFKNDMNYDEKYRLEIADSVSAGSNILGKAIEYNLTIPAPVEVESFSAVPGTDNVTVNLTFKNNMASANDVLVIVVAYDEDGRATDSYAVSGNLSKDGRISITNKVLSGDKVKVLCWDNLTGLNTIHKFDVE